ncbi:MAG: GlsB/YeaQ/YmgE family stress response membrane protein [Streptosporangiales bacterium]|nr:GlsB/YeaQ/YmgE family stress response membrane protein [Streptosporangiales bacterium]
MELNGILSALIAGVVIGALGRLLVPRSGNLGCLLTILIGIVGAAIGLVVGASLDVGFWLTVLFQVLAAAVLVSVFSLGRR